jgi:hypothetical protein
MSGQQTMTTTEEIALQACMDRLEAQMRQLGLRHLSVTLFDDHAEAALSHSDQWRRGEPVADRGTMAEAMTEVMEQAAEEARR